MKVKLQNFSKSNQLLLLDVLDYLVDKGNMVIWSSISSKKFFQSLLDLLRTKDIPEVQMKLLGLIQKWGLNFEDKKNVLPNFYSVYNKLRNSNVQFPNDFESNYQIYISNSNSNNYNKNKNNYDKNDEYEDNDNNDKEEDGETFYYMESLKNKLKVPNFEHKYRRLVNFLVKMHDNIQMANLLMDSREHSGLKDIINTLREGNNTLIDTISGGRLKDEKLMEITLGTTEDINQTLNRDEDLKNGYKPKKFTSYFVLNNVIPIRNNNNNYRSRAKSTKPKKSIQRRDEKYKNYDMNINEYDKNRYKEKMGGPKNADDIFDLFSASNPSNEPGYNQQQNNQPINNFFSSQTQIRGNNNNQYPQLTNNPMNNFFNNNRSTMMNTNNNNNNAMLFSNNNIQGNTMNNNMNNNNFGRQFNQNNNQQRPVMSNFDILEQKLNNLNMEQSNNNFNFNSQSTTQFTQGFNNNNINNNNYNSNNNNNLMSMLDQLGPNPQANSNQLVPYIGGFNNNNNNNNNNNQFNNFNNNNNNKQFNNFNTNNNHNQFNNSGNNNNQFNNFNNNNNQNNNNNFYNNNNRNNNQMNFDTNLGRSQNMNNMNNNNNFGMGQNNSQQMNLEEIEKQQKLKELDELF